MNLQTMTIIFVIIFLPIILISTYYIQMEVDTIRLQCSYDTKLIDATTDALSAFEINTANEDLSSVSDSLRSIIEASNNVLTTTLATNLGMSSATKSKILPYIPAVVYTLYDGYYIYAPTQTPKVVTDPDGVYVRVGDPGTNGSNGKYSYNYEAVENWKNNSGSEPGKSFTTEEYGKILYYSDTTSNPVSCTTNPNNDEAYFSTKYILKSFVPYSMRYKGSDYDITINYTLDNFITVSGTKGDIYYTKSGYLINPNEIIIDGLVDYASIDNADSLIEDNIVKAIHINYKDEDDNIHKITIENDGNAALSEYHNGKKINDNESAMKYYLKAYLFSDWFLKNFGDLKESDAITAYDNEGIKIKYKSENLDEADYLNNSIFYNFSESAKCIFKKKSTDHTFDLKNFDSNFYEHKRKVIKNSIQYNLNLAMIVYNAGQGDEYYQMPVITEPEWDKLLSNISILTFMQGLPCGMKTYNNYAIITSKNNELMANEDEIYYVPIYKFEKDLLDNYDDTSNYFTNSAYISNKGNAYDVVRDVDGNILYYKATDEELEGVRTTAHNSGSDMPINTAHKIDCQELSSERIPMYFQSFASREVKYDKVWNSDKKKYVYDHVVNNCYYCIVNSNYESQALSDQLIKAKLIAIAKIRNNTYKSCAFSTNYGIRFDNTQKTLPTEATKTIDIPDGVYEIELIIEDADLNNYSGNYAGALSIELGSELKTYTTTGKDAQVIKFSDPDKWEKSGEKVNLYLNRVNPKTIIDRDTDLEMDPQVKIVSITYKYK